MQLQQHLTNADTYPQFIVSKIVKQPDGRVDKVPCNPQGIPSSHKDPANWMTLREAELRVAALGGDYRLGFSITDECGIFLYDLDKVYVDGKWNQEALNSIAPFGNAYVEVSQSGSGLHVMGRYDRTKLLPHRNKNASKQIELYTHDRFVMFGGIHPRGDWSTDCTQALNRLITSDFNKPSDAIIPTDNTLQPQNTLRTDDEVLELARNTPSSKNVFGDGASFNDLYEANEAVLGKNYPPIGQGEPFDRSSADLAIANMLATHTRDKDQIIRIMRTSGLVRDKWERGTYLSDTVDKAISDRTAVQLSQHGQSSTATGECQQLDIDMPQEYHGCYYIITLKAIYSIQYVSLMAEKVFNLCYSKPFQDKKPYAVFERHASTTGHVIHQACFRPELPHGKIIVEEDRTSINTYKPVNIKMREGDMKPFFDFFDRMVPDQCDQRILMSYAAALVQNPGLKARWCPVLQGVEGCGKSFFADMVAQVVGERYVHRAKGDELESRFSGHWFAKLLMLVEDVSLKHSKLDDVLKPLITSTRYAFEPKGCDIFMGDYPMNFIITANNIDIVKKEEGTRRFSFFMCAQQTFEDKIRDGFNDAYFDNLARWRTNGGQEFFAHYLHNYETDPLFDFSKGCGTAPNTSTTAQVMIENRSDAELLIQEAVDMERSGFKGGFISSNALTLLFNGVHKGLRISDRQRGNLLKKMGYSYHPGLSDGRTGRIVKPDNTRTRLFTIRDQETRAWKDREQIMKAYEIAQSQS